MLTFRAVLDPMSDDALELPASSEPDLLPNVPVLVGQSYEDDDDDDAAITFDDEEALDGEDDEYDDTFFEDDEDDEAYDDVGDEDLDLEPEPEPEDI